MTKERQIFLNEIKSYFKLQNKIQIRIATHYLDDGETHSILIQTPMMKTRHKSDQDYFKIEYNNYGGGCYFYINDFRKFIDEFEITYEQLDLSFLNSTRKDIEECYNKIEEIKEVIEIKKNKIQKYLELINIPIEFE